MGLNQDGLFVGLTNRPVSTPDRSRRSRGLLVLDALSRRAAPDVARDLEGPLAGPYNPFHLVYADGRRAYLSFLREESGLETQELDPGVHVVCNRDPEDPGSNKVSRIRAALDRVDLEQPFEDMRRALAAVLGSHPDAEHPFENPCVHTPDYGTRSAALIAGGPERRGFWFAAGPPCENKFDDLSRLLA